MQSFLNSRHVAAITHSQYPLNDFSSSRCQGRNFIARQIVLFLCLLWLFFEIIYFAQLRFGFRSTDCAWHFQKLAAPECLTTDFFKDKSMGFFWRDSMQTKPRCFFVGKAHFSEMAGKTGLAIRRMWHIVNFLAKGSANYEALFKEEALIWDIIDWGKRRTKNPAFISREDCLRKGIRFLFLSFALSVFAFVWRRK